MTNNIKKQSEEIHEDIRETIQTNHFGESQFNNDPLEEALNDHFKNA